MSWMDDFFKPPYVGPVTLLAAIASTQSNSTAKLRAADGRFDRSKLANAPPAKVVLVVQLETNDATSAANVDLIDVDGVVVGGGGPGSVVTGSSQSTTSTVPIEIVIDLTAVLAQAASGRFRLRLWTTTAGKTATCSYAYFQITP